MTLCSHQGGRFRLLASICRAGSAPPPVLCDHLLLKDWPPIKWKSTGVGGLASGWWWSRQWEPMRQKVGMNDDSIWRDDKLNSFSGRWNPIFRFMWPSSYFWGPAIWNVCNLISSVHVWKFQKKTTALLEFSYQCVHSRGLSERQKPGSSTMVTCAQPARIWPPNARLCYNCIYSIKILCLTALYVMWCVYVWCRMCSVVGLQH